MNQDERISELRSLKDRIARLESELASDAAANTKWVPRTYYTTYHILAGMVLGMLGAAASLLFNVVGAAMVDKHPLELIRVYLTFPLGESALTVDSGFALAAGCCLYLGTGMILGIPFHMVLSRFFDASGVGKRFLVATILALAVWVVNYYGILVWLQPLIVDGKSWIVDNIPVYVAVLTHLVFGWTMLLIDQWGRFSPSAARA